MQCAWTMFLCTRVGLEPHGCALRVAPLPAPPLGCASEPPAQAAAESRARPRLGNCTGTGADNRRGLAREPQGLHRRSAGWPRPRRGAPHLRRHGPPGACPRDAAGAEGCARAVKLRAGERPPVARAWPGPCHRAAMVPPGSERPRRASPGLAPARPPERAPTPGAVPAPPPGPWLGLGLCTGSHCRGRPPHGWIPRPPRSGLLCAAGPSLLPRQSRPPGRGRTAGGLRPRADAGDHAPKPSGLGAARVEGRHTPIRRRGRGRRAPARPRRGSGRARVVRRGGAVPTHPHPPMPEEPGSEPPRPTESPWRRLQGERWTSPNPNRP